LSPHSRHVSTAEKLKGVVKVSFVNSEGLPEAGIDGGGVFKEFLTEYVPTAFFKT
jgi:hypothetical protein